jgi:hypothetical protein
MKWVGRRGMIGGSALAAPGQAGPAVRPSQVPDRNRRPADQAARPPMRLELRVQQLRGGGDDDPPAAMAEAKQCGPPL